MHMMPGGPPGMPPGIPPPILRPPPAIPLEEVRSQRAVLQVCSQHSSFFGKLEASLRFDQLKFVKWVDLHSLFWRISMLNYFSQ
jgi:hypothetical protein